MVYGESAKQIRIMTDNKPMPNLGLEGKPHRNLKERAMRFAVAAKLFYNDLPKTTEAQAPGRQFLRSSASVGANARSAFRGRSQREYAAKLGIVIGEADESGYWLELMQRTGVTVSQKASELPKESNELAALFTSLVKR